MTASVFKSSAIVSPCGRYRYRLERDFPFPGPTAAVIMANPSTADAYTDDNTIRSLSRILLPKGFGKMIVGNLFAYRATDINMLAKADDPEGPDNGYRLAEIFLDADECIFAWGASAKFPPHLRDHWKDVDRLARAMHCLPLTIGKTCRDGQPAHPLYLAATTPLMVWSPPRV